MDDVLDDGDLTPLWNEHTDLLDCVAWRLHHEGTTSNAHANRPFASRYPRILAEYPRLYKFLNISLPLVNESAEGDARERILSGEYTGPVFEQARWKA